MGQPTDGKEKDMDLYIDGERIETPKLTKLEKKLALRLSEASFGSLENDDFASVRSDDGAARVDSSAWSSSNGRTGTSWARC